MKIRRICTSFYANIRTHLKKRKIKLPEEIFNAINMSDYEVPTRLKNASDRAFYSLPNEYSIKSTQESEKSAVLFNEIYSNISCNGATFCGPFGHRSVIYCDYAASGQPLNFIEDYIRKKVLPFYGNTHTTITATALQSTYFRHEAKDIIRKAVNASEHDAVVFTGYGSTSAINKLIHGLHLKLPVVVFVGPYEHNSNLLPWREINAEVIRIKETSEGTVDLGNLEKYLLLYKDKNLHLIGSFSAASNVTGIITDDKAISILLHKYGALSFWDYAAAGPYIQIDMNPMVMGQSEGLAYKDAIFLSPHKFVGGPDTPGVLVAKKKLFVNPKPCEPGGGTIFFVTHDTHRYLKEIEMREEGGTPSIIGAIRAGMAFQLKEAISSAVISKREQEITTNVFTTLQNVPNLHILGNTTVQRIPIFSFVIHHPESNLYLHHNFVCALLNDLFGIQTRSGCACAGAYALDLLGIDKMLAYQFDELLAENRSLDRIHLRRKGEYSEREVLRPGFVRFTLPYFMLDEDINFILEAISMVAENGWKILPQYFFNPETGEWKHKKQQVHSDRKWLGAISYASGHFTVKDTGKETVELLNNMEILYHAKQVFQNAVTESSKKCTPDQELIFDSESSVLRWFLLPSEAIQCIAKDFATKREKPVFSLRKTLNSTLRNSELQYCSKDINCNFPEYQAHNTEEATNSNLMCKFLTKSSHTHTDLTIHAQKCKWHSPPGIIFRPFLKAVNQFEMIKSGDRVLVCISGGKDSLSLLHTLHQYQFYAKKQGIKFEMAAMTVDPKSPLYDPSSLKVYLKALNVPYFYEEQDIISQATNLEKCTSICSFCSRLKRGRIYSCARRENYNVIALGQHLDDLAESFLMSVFHNGRLRTMKAHYTDQSSSLRIVRPFVYVREKDLRRFAEHKKLPIIPENCPACFEAPKERHRIKQLLAAQEVQFPNLYRSLRTAMNPLMSINLTGVENKLLGKNATLCFNDDDSDDENVI